MRSASLSLLLFLLVGTAFGQQGQRIQPSQINFNCTNSLAPFYNAYLNQCQAAVSVGSAAGSVGQVPYFSAPSLINGLNIYGLPYYSPGTGVSSVGALNQTVCRSTYVTCFPITATFSTPLNGTAYGQVEQDLFHLSLNTYGVGTNNGATGLPTPNWSITQSLGILDTIQRRGIWTGLSVAVNRYSVGDTNGVYNYINCATAPTGPADEGCTQFNTQGGEIHQYFHGTIATGGTGAIQPTLNFASGDAHTIDGGILLDISKGTISGNLNGLGNGNSLGVAFVRTIPVTNTLPITSAYGIAPSIINVVTLATTPQSVVVPVTLQAIGGSTPSFVTGGTVCLANTNYAEQAAITAVAAPSGGTQNLTLAVRQYYPAGTAVFQGSTCGQYISFDQDLAFSGMRTSYFAFGSLDGTNLIYSANTWGLNLFGSPQIIPEIGLQAQTTTGGYHLYPGAEIVANNAIGYQPILEANSVNWAAGDTVESPHGAAFENHAMSVSTNQYTPTSQGLGSYVLQLQTQGQGVGPSNHMVLIQNNNPCNFYTTCGGPIAPPPLFDVAGNFADFFHFLSGPAPGNYPESNSVIFINKTAAGGSSNTPFTLFTLPALGNTNFTTINYDPGTQTVSFSGPIKAPSFTFTGNQTANTFYAAPSTGGGPAAFRTIANADVAAVTTLPLLALPSTQVSGLGTFAVANVATPPAIGTTTPNTGAFTTVKVGNSPAAFTYLATLTSSSTTPGAVAAATCVDTAFTVAGIVAGMNVTMPAPPSTQTANIAIGGATATAANTVTIRFCNASATAATPVAGIYTVGAFK